MLLVIGAESRSTFFGARFWTTGAGVGEVILAFRPVIYQAA